MKRLFRLLLILGLAAGTWSCADDGTPSVSINGGTDFLSLDHLARSGKITVNAPAPWSVTLAPENYGQDEKPDWLTLSAEEGPAGYSEIDVTFAENPGPARSASLLFTCDGKTSAFTVSQSAGGTGFDAPDYYFYISVGTMPTLYSGLHLLSHDKPSYVSYERASTFDAAEFPDRAFVYPVADPTGYATNEELRAMSEAMKRRILEINAEDPTAVFGLWVDDLRCRLGYDWFVAQGIDSARVKVTMLSDGTATYNNFHNYFGDAATAEQNWNDYAAEVEALDWNHGGRYPETRAPEEFASYAAGFAAAGVRIFGGCCGTTAEHVAALRAAVEAVDFSAFVPPRRDPDVIPCASEKEARFITPDIDVGETIECTSDLLEDILEAEENAPQGALKIAIYDEDDLYTFAENQYAVKDALCLWTDVPELLEQALRLYQGRAFWDGTGELEAAFLQEMARKYGLVLL